MRTCPYCGRIIPDDALYCPYCGRELGKKKSGWKDETLKIGDFTFHTKRGKTSMKICGYEHEHEIVSFNCSFIRPNGYILYKKLMSLWKEGHSDVVQKLLEYAGFKVSIEEVEERFKETERQMKEDAERWERIRRAWGL